MPATRLRGEAPAVAYALDLVEDGDRRVAGPEEIAVQRMGDAPLDGAGGGNQGLADDLAAKDPLPADVGASAAEEIVFQRFEVEYGKKDVDGARHANRLAFGRRCGGPFYRPAQGAGVKHRTVAGNERRSSSG